MYAEVDGVIRGWVGKISKPIDRSYTSTTDGLVPVSIERSCHVGVMFCRDLNIIAGFTEQGAEGFARVFAAIRLPNALKLRTRISR